MLISKGINPKLERSLLAAIEFVRAGDSMNLVPVAVAICLIVLICLGDYIPMLLAPSVLAAGST